jgi:hypothetical protein
MPEPMAYAVFCPKGSEFDYKIFPYKRDAEDEIDCQLADGHERPDVIPLIAGQPIKDADDA